MIRLKQYFLISLTLVLTGAKAATLDSLRSKDYKAYARANQVIDFQFPRDYGPHEDFQTEWWYFTGNLKDKEGNEFGYQLTIFRNNIAANFPKRGLKTNQIYMGHFAISDIRKNKFYSYEIFQRGAAGLAGANSKEIWINNWTIDTENMRLKASHENISIDLDLNSVKELTLQGNKGLSQKSPEIGNASYYYSYTRLASKGEIVIKDRTYDVTGLSWMDREWSTSALSNKQQGWDWFSLQLSDSTDLMYYQIREDNTAGNYSSGSLVDQKSTKTPIEAEDIEIKILEYWISPETRIKYPSEWQITISKEKLKLNIKAKINNQEHLFSYSYWEGAVIIKGNHKDKLVSGEGYVELTGYQ